MSDFKKIVKSIVPVRIWKAVRLKHILRQHKNVASLCESLLSEENILSNEDVYPKKILPENKIIWQYWAQGYSEIPEVVRMCFESVDKNRGDYLVIRLSDSNLGEYIDLPEYVIKNRGRMTTAHFSDILRLYLLSAYGGIWLDATVFMTGSVPDYLFDKDYFVYQRDPDERNKSYWENVYAYYFCWHKDFRVNMLSSIMYARKGSAMINCLLSLLNKWWQNNDYLPDYFMLQIFYDVLIKGKMKEYNCEVVNDCYPHYLQQYKNDPNFDLMSKEMILASFPFHKLTYK